MAISESISVCVNVASYIWGTAREKGLTLKNADSELEVATCLPDVRKSCSKVRQRKFNHPRGGTKVWSGAFWVRHQVQTNSRNPAKTSYPALVPGPMKTEHSGAAHRSANQSARGLLWRDTCTSVLSGPLKHDLLPIFCCAFAWFTPHFLLCFRFIFPDYSFHHEFQWWNW